MLGFLPIFAAILGLRLFPAMVILTIMTVPIVSSLTREIFTTVPPAAKEGALALGATRWEMIKTVVLPYSRAGDHRRGRSSGWAARWVRRSRSPR